MKKVAAWMQRSRLEVMLLGAVGHDPRKVAEENEWLMKIGGGKNYTGW